MINKESLIEHLLKVDTLNVIIQTTNKCILSCRYCFAKNERTDEPKFSSDTLSTIIKESFSTRHKRIVFEWTGGEPFLMGIDFYKTVIEFQKKFSTKYFQNCIQTSGYLLDKELIDFLVDEKFTISTTIDGTEEIHNFNRPAGTQSSLQKVLKTREYIIKKQGYCGFISTITKKNIGHETEILDYFRQLNINSFHSNPYVYFKKNYVGDRSLALSSTDYAKYFVNQFNAWIEQGKVLPVPLTIDYFIKSIVSRKRLSNTFCTFGGRCLTNSIAVIYNGDVYICPKFIDNSNMLLGNLTSHHLNDILSMYEGRIASLIDERLTDVNSCIKSKCNYFYVCNGGCPYYSYLQSEGKNISERDILCSGKKMIFEYVENFLILSS